MCRRARGPLARCSSGRGRAAAVHLLRVAQDSLDRFRHTLRFSLGSALEGLRPARGYRAIGARALRLGYLFYRALHCLLKNKRLLHYWEKAP